MRWLSLCWDSPHFFTQNPGFCTVRISFDTIYQTICQNRTTQWYDGSIDGLPKFQSLVLRESEINPMYSIVRPSPFQFLWNLSRFDRFVARSDHRCCHGTDWCQRSMSVVLLELQSLLQWDILHTWTSTQAMIPRVKCHRTIRKW